jgi:hypothetical protein
MEENQENQQRGIKIARPVNGICRNLVQANECYGQKTTYQIKYGQRVVNASISRHDEPGINAHTNNDIDKHRQDNAKDD